MENNNQQSFWQFSDQLRHQTNNLANLSLNDSIWSNSYVSKRPQERRNFDVNVGGEFNSVNSSNSLKANESDFNGFNHGWKIGGGSDFNGLGSSSSLGSIGLNGGFNKGIIYSKPSLNFNHHNNNNNNNNVNVVVNTKSNKNGSGKGEDDYYYQNHHGSKSGKKNKNNNNSNKDSNNNSDNNNNSNKNSVDKRFKTLPPSESLPRNETVGGYIFVCNNETMEENLKRQLFGLPPRYRDSVRAITPGLPLFLYNYSTHQLHGIFEAASFGGTNIDPKAWEDKKNPGESRFPAQVRVVTRKVCEPLEEDSFRPILHHYDGPKFRLELNIPEALSLLDIFAENDP
ncbi:unnamed protein product [Camellia sinensis]